MDDGKTPPRSQMQIKVRETFTDVLETLDPNYLDELSNPEINDAVDRIIKVVIREEHKRKRRSKKEADEARKVFDQYFPRSTPRDFPSHESLMADGGNQAEYLEEQQ